MTKKTLRVLCLHGYRTNVQVMEDQMRALHRSLGPDAEFVYLNGPFEAEGEAFPGIEEFYKGLRPFYEWMQLKVGESNESIILLPEDTPRFCEWLGENADDWFMRYAGLERALAYLDDKIQELRSFDVAIGFSQGGMILTVLSMWCLHKYNRRFWKLSICISTCIINAENAKYLFVTPDDREILVPYPSVHVIGKADPVREKSFKLLEMYDAFPTGGPTGRIVLEHTEGHRFPSFKKHQTMYAQLVDMMNQYRSETVAEQEDREEQAQQQVARL